MQGYLFRQDDHLAIHTYTGALSKNIRVISQGKVVFKGEPRDLLNNEEVLEAHLGVRYSGKTK